MLIRITQLVPFTFLLLFSGIPSHSKPLTNPPAVATPEKIDMEMTWKLHYKPQIVTMAKNGT